MLKIGIHFYHILMNINTDEIYCLFMNLDFTNKQMQEQELVNLKHYKVQVINCKDISR